MASFFSKLLSIGSDKELKELKKISAQVNELEPRFQALTDEELRAQTDIFKQRYKDGESLDDLLPEAFATVREASVRTLGMRHYDVQVIGAIALHRGMIAEMKTGEGKTLVSTLAGYLNALSGEGVHIVTVNDYLAKRDAEQMSQVYNFLGLTVGLLQNGMNLSEKRPAYAADITYGTNSEFGFDYLRDNMVTRPDQRVQRGHNFTIVDEVDSILIDEARTPLIISGAGNKSAATYKDFARAVRGLRPEIDYDMDEAKHTITATDEGLTRIENALGIDDIYADMSGQLVNHLQQALKAEYMFHRNQQYIVTDGEVKIVDEFTGRIMEGRRYSEGLHQAIEAKEGVYVREENQTLATITLQNYFRLYKKLSGMTGTAMTEDSEFRQIYNLPVQAIPPNKPVIREDNEDKIYRTIDAKFKAVADEIAKRHETGQPVLVGTVSIESSERLSRLLQKRGIKHEILNAKFHAREAAIVAQAGRLGAVTIATNMAGRGTDILLGGNANFMAEDVIATQGIDPEEITDEQKETILKEVKAGCNDEHQKVLEVGGLCVIGTERHESRRIDNQLRGRAGRQGDPGVTQFYLSLEDDIMRLFAGDRLERISDMMQQWDMPDDAPIQHRMVSRSVENAQRKVEEMNFSMRKHVLEYDDVMNKQRQVIYEERNKILDGKDLTAHVEEVTRETSERAVEEYCPKSDDPDFWDLEGLEAWMEETTGQPFEYPDDDIDNYDALIEDTYRYLMDQYEDKAERLGDTIMTELATQVMLRVIDTRWMSYLQEMDYLKTGIGLRGFGQRDPLVEYKTEAFRGFAELVSTMYEDFLRTILRIELNVMPQEQSNLNNVQYSGPAEVDGDQPHRPRHMSTNQPAPDKARTYRKSESHDPYANVGRNDPCPCGSGKKFKNCHGINA